MKRLRNLLMKNFHYLCIISVIAIGVMAIVGSGGGGGGGGDGATSNPVVTITSPSDGSSYSEGSNINFVGECVDDEDGTLTGSSLVWTSNQDGQIGTGTSCSTSSLSVGTHTITLTATDSDSATGSDSITVTITCELTSGEWSGTADFGELSFTVNDTSTGIPKITYNWISFTCGAVTRSGSVAISTTTPWPITDSQFTINNTIDSDFEITLNGTFDDTCRSVSGTWEAVSFGTTCSGTWDASSCDGPVPCLTTDWGNVFREFEETDLSQVLVLSDGAVIGVGGITDAGDIFALAGPVTDCYNGTLTEGGLDFDLDGVVDYWFVSVSGDVNICNDNLRITDIVLDGAPDPDIEATYVGTFTASVHIASEVPQEFLLEVMEKVRGNF